jgi:hypothetical protein
MLVLAGALTLAGCGTREDLGGRENRQEADGALPPGAIPAAPEAEPGSAASAAPAPGDSVASASAPGAGQTSQADTGAARPAGAPQQR